MPLGPMHSFHVPRLSWIPVAVIAVHQSNKYRSHSARKCKVRSSHRGSYRDRAQLVVLWGILGMRGRRSRVLCGRWSIMLECIVWSWGEIYNGSFDGLWWGGCESEGHEEKGEEGGGLHIESFVGTLMLLVVGKWSMKFVLRPVMWNVEGRKGLKISYIFLPMHII